MNKKYNRWTVLSQHKICKENRVYLRCRCNCGVEKDVIIKNLKSGMSKSCGCLNKEKIIGRNTKHNMRFTKVWTAWQAMKNRCYNKNVRQYSNYGGRGIEVCEKWRDNFLAFYDDVGDSPENKSLDRIDNNGNYEPSNVKWSSYKEQCQNRSNNHKIGGRCLSEIDRLLGGSDGLVYKRLKRGWSTKRAITEKSNAIL